jgi:hypothetical protein
MFNPSRDDFDEIDHRRLCLPGAELVVFVPNPCIAKGHGPQAYHYKDGGISSCVDYEDPAYDGKYWPNKLAPLIAAAGLDAEHDHYEEQLTRLICDHLGLPPLNRDTLMVDRAVMASYF